MFLSFMQKSMRREMSYLIGAALLVLLTLCAAEITRLVNKGFTACDAEYMDSTANRYSLEVSGILSQEFHIGSTLQSCMEQYEDIPAAERRSYFDGLLRKVLEENPSLVDAWVAFEPDALDGLDEQFANAPHHDQTGRFIPYWTQSGGAIDCVALTDYEEGFWYVNPLHSPKGILIDPNLYEVGGKEIWVCGAAFPIFDKNRKPIGVAGLDMSLETLSEIIHSVTIYKTGYLSLISAKGQVAVDRDRKNEGQISKHFENAAAMFKQSAASGDAFGFYDEENVYHYYAPIKVGNADQVWFAGLNVPKGEMTARSAFIRNIVIVIFCITIVLVMLFVFRIVSSVSKEIGKGVSAMKDIAQGDGDLTVRMQINKKNELGSMYQYFNETMQKLQMSISGVKCNANNLNEHGKTLASETKKAASLLGDVDRGINLIEAQTAREDTAIKQMQEAVEGIKSSIANVNAAAKDERNSVLFSVESVKSITDSIAAFMSLFDDSGRLLCDMVRSTQEGQEKLKGMNETISLLAEKSDAILDTSRAIQSIAEQTNLLAMNAAIEAAHAGEQGKGFAVVADEIRKLAENSNTQATRAADVIQESIEMIEKMTAASGDVIKSFDKVYNTSCAVQTQESNMTQSMKEQQIGSEKAIEAMEKIRCSSIKTQEDSDGSMQSSSLLEEKLHQLEDVVVAIRSGTYSMINGVQKIVAAVQNIEGVSDQSARDIQSLFGQVQQFKV